MIPFSFWIVPLVLATLVVPGALVVKPLRLAAGDRLTVAVAASSLVVFLGWWCLWIAGVPAWWCSVAVASATGACGLFGWRQIKPLFRDDIVRWQAVGFAAVAMHALLLHAAIFCYSGGLWGGDWCTHYTQAVFFMVDGDPRPNRFPAGDAITARPPLMNIVAAHFCRLSNLSFADYQIVMTLLSAAACLPAFMIADRLVVLLGGNRRHAVVAATAAMIVLPAFAENAVYPWTKLLAAFFVVPGLVLWGDGVGNATRPRRTLAAILLTAGVLTHYSAAVYVVAVVAHELVSVAATVWRRRHPVEIAAILRADAIAAAAAVAVFLPWIGWALFMFGPAGTFATSTAVVDAAVYTPAGNLLKVLLNIRDTLVPSFLRSETELVALLRAQPSPLGRIRDFWFLPYEVNFPAALGVVGAWATPLAVGLLWRRLGGSAERMFWVTVVALGFVLGVAAHGGRDDNGLAHICLHPLMIMGAAVLAGVLPWLPRALQILVVGGWAFDYVLGTVLQAWVQAWPFTLGDPLVPQGPPSNSAGLSLCATSNLINKQQLGLVYLSERFAAVGIEPVALLVAAVTIGAVWLSMVAWHVAREHARGR
ncbi:hypothetical protein EBR56_00790 [bacterium]|nr:hypothetical protein [bacterium]